MASQISTALSKFLMEEYADLVQQQLNAPLRFISEEELQAIRERQAQRDALLEAALWQVGATMEDAQEIADFYSYGAEGCDWDD